MVSTSRIRSGNGTSLNSLLVRMESGTANDNAASDAGPAPKRRSAPL
jgi:hypothetical protein